MLPFLYTSCIVYFMILAIWLIIDRIYSGNYLFLDSEGRSAPPSNAADTPTSGNPTTS